MSCYQSGVIKDKSVIARKLLFLTSLVFLVISLIIASFSYSSIILLANAQTNDDSNTNTTTTTRPNAVVQQQQWKTYTDEKLSISLQYPSDWVVIKQKTNSRFESGGGAAEELTIRGQVSEFYMIKAPVKKS